MRAQYDLFSYVSIMSTYVEITKTGSAYSALKCHMASAVILIIALAFVLHFELLLL